MMKTRLRLLLTLLMAIAMDTQVKAQSNGIYAEYNSNTKTLTFRCDRNMSQYGSNAFSALEHDDDGNPGWYGKDIKKVVFDSSFKSGGCQMVSSTINWFKDQSSLTTIEGIEDLNMSSLLNTDSMFEGCSSLTSLDLSRFNTQRVKSMNSMFKGCSSLMSLDLSGFNTSRVTDMGFMFQGCSSLTSLDLSHFDTSKVKSMSYMFMDCTQLNSLEISTFVTTSLTSMISMFRGCKRLYTIDLSSFNTSNVVSMLELFYACANTKTIYVGSEWSTSKLRENMSLPNGTVLNGDTDMFMACVSLKGAMGTVYDNNHVGKDYAHVDRGSSDPGYLTGTQGITLVNAKNFPDADFRRQLKNHFGNYLTSSDLTVSDLDLMYGTIENLKGIELFTKIDLLDFHENKVKTADLSNNKKLKTIYCYQNQMRGSDMDNFITNLPSVTGGELYVYQCEDLAFPDGNEMTSAQVAAAQSKGWTVYIYDNYDNDDWAETNGYYLFGTSRFPDDNFRNRLIEYYSWPCIGAISAESAEGRTRLACVNLNVSSLEGIECFPNITELLIYRNNLTSVDLSNNKKLYMVYCFSNNIKGSDMDKLIASLPEQPEGKTGQFRVINNKDANFPEGNVITEEQVADAKAKRWMPLQYNGSDWVEYSGSESGITTNISEAEVKPSTDQPMYNLSGQRVGKDYKGIVIHNGKKVVIK